MIYYTRIPDLQPKTLREYAKKFKDALHRIGEMAYLNFFDVSDKQLLERLPSIDERDSTLVYEGDEVYYGWDLNRWNWLSGRTEYVPLDDDRILIGAI